MNTQIKKFFLRIKSRKAQGVVEFALVLPVLMLLIVGIFAFGHLFFVHIMNSSAASEAVRYGMASGETPDGVIRYLDCTGMRDAAKRVGSAVGVNGGTNLPNHEGIYITYDSGPGTSVKATCPANGNFTAGSEPEINLGDRVVVRIQITYKPYFPLVNLPEFPVTSQSARTIVKSISVGATAEDFELEPTPTCEDETLPTPKNCEEYGVISGSLTREMWLNIPGSQISNLTSAPAYPDAPTYTDKIFLFESPQTSPNIDNFGERLRGYICPPYDGDYTFYFVANNAGILYLSSDQNPGSKSAIITVSDWTYDWAYGDLRTSGTMTLTAGQMYYVEVLHKEDVSLDYITVGWSGPGFNDPTIISGEFLVPYIP